MKRQRLGRPECPYMERWVLNLGLFSIRLHHWFRSDDKRAEHDHPSWFLTLILKGSYTDQGELLTPGTVRFRRATYRHVVDVTSGGVWTLLIFGRKTRDWGFWVRRASGKLKWTKSNKYFLENGHHPCDQP